MFTCKARLLVLFVVTCEKLKKKKRKTNWKMERRSDIEGAYERLPPSATLSSVLAGGWDHELFAHQGLFDSIESLLDSHSIRTYYSQNSRGFS